MNLQLILDLADDDDVALKESTVLATSSDDTYITITPFVFTDGGGVMFVGIPPDNAVQASSVISDVSQPTLVSFIYDAPSETDLEYVLISLGFSKMISIMTFNISEVRLQSAANIMSTA